MTAMAMAMTFQRGQDEVALSDKLSCISDRKIIRSCSQLRSFPLRKLSPEQEILPLDVGMDAYVMSGRSRRGSQNWLWDLAPSSNQILAPEKVAREIFHPQTSVLQNVQNEICPRKERDGRASAIMRGAS